MPFCLDCFFFLFLVVWVRGEVVAEALNVSHSQLWVWSHRYYCNWSLLFHNNHQQLRSWTSHGFPRLHRPWAPTWPLAASRKMDPIWSPSAAQTSKHQHGLHPQHGSQTSPWSPVVALITDINMVSGGSTNRRYPHGWPPAVTPQTRNDDSWDACSSPWGNKLWYLPVIIPLRISSSISL